MSAAELWNDTLPPNIRDADVLKTFQKSGEGKRDWATFSKVNV